MLDSESHKRDHNKVSHTEPESMYGNSKVF